MDHLSPFLHEIMERFLGRANRSFSIWSSNVHWLAGDRALHNDLTLLQYGLSVTISTWDHGEVLGQSLLVPLQLVVHVLAGQRVLVTALNFFQPWHSWSIMVFLVFLQTIGLDGKPARNIISRIIFGLDFKRQFCEKDKNLSFVLLEDYGLKSSFKIFARMHGKQDWECQLCTFDIRPF